MNLDRTPLAMPHLEQAARFFRLACFLYGCLEREHLLNMKALTCWVPGDGAKVASGARGAVAPDLQR